MNDNDRPNMAGLDSSKLGRSAVTYRPGPPRKPTVEKFSFLNVANVGVSPVFRRSFAG